MGRKKKIIEFDEQRFSNLSTEEKLLLISDFNQLFQYELSKIPYSELNVPKENKEKAEIIAKSHFEKLGYDVYQSKINDGYRSIGVIYYWQEYISKITTADFKLIKKIITILGQDDFKELAYAVKDKNGTPDLLLIKDGEISFVEVKYNYETVKSSTIEFYIKYVHKWAISILRVIKQK